MLLILIINNNDIYKYFFLIPNIISSYLIVMFSLNIERIHGSDWKMEWNVECGTMEWAFPHARLKIRDSYLVRSPTPAFCVQMRLSASSLHLCLFLHDATCSRHCFALKFKFKTKRDKRFVTDEIPFDIFCRMLYLLRCCSIGNPRNLPLLVRLN